MTALEVFEALEAAHRKGHLQLSASDVDTLSEQGQFESAAIVVWWSDINPSSQLIRFLVLLALATQDYVNIIPRFLQSNVSIHPVF